jgi:putative ABC transport system permease protein
MDFIQKKDVGYSREQILIINNISQIDNGVEVLTNNIRQLSGVENLAVSGFLPVNYYRSNDSFFSSPTLDTQGAISMQSWTIDENYIPTMNMQIVKGRAFSKDMATDSTGIILNEAAAKFLGDQEIIGKNLYRIMDPEAKSVMVYHVIGVVKDFNYSTLRDQVKPLSFVYGADRGGLSVKINTGDIPSLLAAIEKHWKAVAPGLPFEHSFMDDDYNKLYVGERQVGKLFIVFASLSIFISCLGLFGLATFMAEQRTKEIGIRKVLGASVSAITLLLSRDFLKLVVISVILATPIAWFFMNQWLQGFAYRIDINWWIFIVSGIIAVVIALVTVSYQAIAAGMSNPVNSLRTE